MEKHVFELSKELVRKGHRVDVFTSNETRGNGKLAAFSESSGVRVHRFRSLASLGEFGKLWPGFVTEILADDFDVIHAHTYRHPHTDMSVLASKLKFATTSVMTAHSPFHPNGTRGPFADALVQLYDGVVAPFTLRAYDRIVSLTPAEVERLVALGAPKDKIAVISHGVGDEHYGPPEDNSFLDRFGLDRDGFILYLGRIHHTKGVDVLLKAFAKVPDQASQVRLVVAGPAISPEEMKFEERLRSMAKSLGIENRVTFTGQLSDEEKLSAYDACKFFVLPSIYEPYGIVLLEAAAHGKPLISTKTDGPVSIIEEGVSGFLVKPNDPDELAKAMRTLLMDYALREKVSAQAREMAKRHSWENIAGQIERLYSRDHNAN